MHHTTRWPERRTTMTTRTILIAAGSLLLALGITADARAQDDTGPRKQRARVQLEQSDDIDKSEVKKGERKAKAKRRAKADKKAKAGKKAQADRKAKPGDEAKARAKLKQKLGKRKAAAEAGLKKRMKAKLKQALKRRGQAGARPDAQRSPRRGDLKRGDARFGRGPMIRRGQQGRRPGVERGRSPLEGRGRRPVRGMTGTPGRRAI
jgi:hypothetical protein